MVVIGLTGGIASGKSIVSKMLKEYGLPIIDGDVISRDIMQPGSEVIKKLQTEFGDEIINENSTLNRKKLSSIVFSDSEKLKRLNNITHPAIRDKILKQIDHFKSIGYQACVVDGALLIEGNFLDIIHELIVVDTNLELQLVRLIKRDAISRETALNIINKQMPLSEKKKYADYIIDNNFDLEYTQSQVNTILNEVIGSEGADV